MQIIAESFLIDLSSTISASVGHLGGLFCIWVEYKCINGLMDLIDKFKISMAKYMLLLSSVCKHNPHASPVLCTFHDYRHLSQCSK